MALASGRIPSLVRHQGPQHTSTLGDPFLLDIAHHGLNRLVRFGPFLNEGLWTGADDVRVYRCESEARRRVAWVRAWPKNVGVASEGAVEATRSMGKRVSY